MIATGESLKPDPGAIAARVRHLNCVAVNNAFLLAPWAKVLVSCDPDWWKAYPEAKAFPGEKWCGNEARGVRRIPPAPGIFTNTNSGLLGLHVAVTRGARRVLLLGVDMKGSHYFGRYTNGRPNTEDDKTIDRYALFLRQFADYAKRLPSGVVVINCSTESALTVFPKMTLDEALATEARA